MKRLAPPVMLLLVASCTGAPADNVGPTARLTTPAMAEARLPVTFDASRSSDADGSLIAFTYVFGDGTPAVTRVDNTIKHVYPGPGRFTIQLTVEDDDHVTSVITRDITLVERLDPPYCVSNEDCEEGQRCDVDGVCWIESP